MSRIEIYKQGSTWNHPSFPYYVRCEIKKEFGVEICTYLSQSVPIDDNGIVIEKITLHINSNDNLSELITKLQETESQYSPGCCSIDFDNTSWGDDGSELVLTCKRQPTSKELNLFNQLKSEYDKQENETKAVKLKKKELAELQRLKEKYE